MLLSSTYLPAHVARLVGHGAVALLVLGLAATGALPRRRAFAGLVAHTPAVVARERHRWKQIVCFNSYFQKTKILGKKLVSAVWKTELSCD